MDFWQICKETLEKTRNNNVFLFLFYIFTVSWNPAVFVFLKPRVCRQLKISPDSFYAYLNALTAGGQIAVERVEKSAESKYYGYKIRVNARGAPKRNVTAVFQKLIMTDAPKESLILWAYMQLFNRAAWIFNKKTVLKELHMSEKTYLKARAFLLRAGFLTERKIFGRGLRQGTRFLLTAIDRIVFEPIQRAALPRPPAPETREERPAPGPEPPDWPLPPASYDDLPEMDGSELLPASVIQGELKYGLNRR